ncbi:MAG: agmatine deiminase family protein [Chitinophagaceae bacterium]|nr:agmatine deiminase family protein [Oligoflexus sp.]
MKAFPVLATAVLSFVAAWVILSWTPNGASSKSPANFPIVRPIAEFEQTFGIGISEQMLFKKQGIVFLKTLLASNARVYVFISGDRRAEVEKLLRSTPLLHGAEREAIVKIQLEHESIWTRDYFPIPVLKVIPHLVPTPSFVDFVYRDGNTLDDAAIHQLALAINLSVEHLPIVLDGGNFMTNGESCVLSEEVSEDPEILLLNSPEPPLESNLPAIFKAALGCRKTIIVSQIPHPHVDMWMKFLNTTTVAVNRIDVSAIDATPAISVAEREKARKIAGELDKTAARLAQDFTVVRMPMPAPMTDLFMTYSNAVLSNGKAVVPRYSKLLKADKNPAKAQSYAKILIGYEREAETIYRRFGFDVTFIDANDLIQDGGAFHCVTFHLPDLDAIFKDKGFSANKSTVVP